MERSRSGLLDLQEMNNLIWVWREVYFDDFDELIDAVLSSKNRLSHQQLCENTTNRPYIWWWTQKHNNTQTINAWVQTHSMLYQWDSIQWVWKWRKKVAVSSYQYFECSQLLQISIRVHDNNENKCKIHWVLPWQKEQQIQSEMNELWDEIKMCRFEE
jgi:hypothetical protein